MHYDMDYSKLDGQAKIDAAIQDIKDYMTPARFEISSKYLREHYPDGCSWETMCALAGLAGVQGYPVEAWMKYLWPQRDA